ncbi:hypothetical protein G7K_5854-t1 [Saitoella complicata NRRL Y-17804]|uniref:Uncharacterized protein n=1 Tax=Saitoella complicata (strain BCRC 22490 / CBS 7301 / JCM 7358 / NBRC 10748 / NRRL Y-17804) TaxID=698492 RepID=A0A0E9NPY5_SAICN|nr:hypothetical protein G7K_5854-t1 [Saitoella complicata NRRL Y-17804]
MREKNVLDALLVVSNVPLTVNSLRNLLPLVGLNDLVNNGGLDLLADISGVALALDELSGSVGDGRHYGIGWFGLVWFASVCVMGKVQWTGDVEANKHAIIDYALTALTPNSYVTASSEGQGDPGFGDSERRRSYYGRTADVNSGETRHGPSPASKIRFAGDLRRVLDYLSLQMQLNARVR